MVAEFLGWMTHALPGGYWVIVLAGLRVLSVFAVLLALTDVWAHRHFNRRAAAVMLTGLVMLGFAQLIGALTMTSPTAVIPTPFSLTANTGLVLICLAIYLRGVIEMRR